MRMIVGSPQCSGLHMTNAFPIKFEVQLFLLNSSKLALINSYLGKLQSAEATVLIQWFNGGILTNTFLQEKLVLELSFLWAV